MTLDEIELVAAADVGRHHVTGRQSHVPEVILERLGVEPGDVLVYRTRDDGAVVVEAGRCPA